MGRTLTIDQLTHQRGTFRSRFPRDTVRMRARLGVEGVIAEGPRQGERVTGRIELRYRGLRRPDAER